MSWLKKKCDYSNNEVDFRTWTLWRPPAGCMKSIDTNLALLNEAADDLIFSQDDSLQSDFNLLEKNEYFPLHITSVTNRNLPRQFVLQKSGFSTFSPLVRVLLPLLGHKFTCQNWEDEESIRNQNISSSW